MTNKEAIKILKNMILEDKRVYGDKPKQRNEALDLAIKVLEQQLKCGCNTCEYYPMKDERPQGEWEVIWHKDIYGRWSNYYEYKCSVCHNSYNDYSSGRKTAFCQFCEAKMKGGTK